MERYRRMSGRTGPLSALAVFATCFSPRMAPVAILRAAGFFYAHNFGFAAKFFSVLNVLVFGIEVSPKVQIGGGLFLPHTVGTVIGASRIGNNCTIMQGVTLGTSVPDMGFDASLRPIIGDDVLIGSGAKVIGGITVGNHAKIGANAVVLEDVPAYALAVGVPAKVLSRA